MDMKYTLEMRGKYVQGPGAIHDIGRYTLPLGDRAIAMGGPTALSLTQDAISESLKAHGVGLASTPFKGRNTDEETERLTGIADDSGANVVIGIGGGQALDTSKAIAHSMQLPLVQVPTLASTDAPCAGNPDLVLVDTEIIVNSPPRLTVAGMGDALATPFEAEACIESDSPNFRDGRATALAFAAAKLVYEILMEHGVEAKRCNEERRLSPAFEKVVEANTLLSGVGYENCGLSVAHGLWSGMLHVEGFRDKDVHHGEIVGWFTIVQLVLEDRPRELIDEVVEFCGAVGLPISLDDPRLLSAGREGLLAGIRASFTPGSTMYHVPFSIDAQMVEEALLRADAIGREFGKGSGSGS